MQKTSRTFNLHTFNLQFTFCRLSPYVIAPGANPTFIWVTNSIKNGQVPTNPPLTVNGSVTVVDGGLALDGFTGSLDAGEFSSIGEYTGEWLYQIVM